MDLPRLTDPEEALKDKAKKAKEEAKPLIEKFEQRVAALVQDAQNKNATVTDDLITLPVDERKQRIRETLLALPELSGGAKRTDYLTDVAPRFLIAAILSCANHIFMDVVKAVDGRIALNKEALGEIVQDYHEHLLSDVFIGLRKGFLDESEYKCIAELAKSGLKVKVKNVPDQEQDKTVKVRFGTPKQVIAELVEAIERMTL